MRLPLCCVVAAIAACGPRPTRVGAGAGDPAESADNSRWYRLSWRGHTVGWALDTEWPGRVERVEHLELRRGDRTAVTHVAIEIDVEPDLTPTAIRLRRITAERPPVQRELVRTAGGWFDGATRIAPPDAMPTELVPLIVRARGSFAGPVILAGWDFAVGDGVVIPAGNRRLAARTVIGDRAIEAAVELDIAGNATTIVDSSGTVATRTDRDTAGAAWTLVDMIDAGSIELADTVVPIEAVLVPAGSLAPPPAIPGQRIAVDGGRWRVTLDPAIPGALLPGPATTGPLDAEIASITRAVHDAIVPSLGPATATAGDCTAYAVAFAGYARMADIAVQVVTGFVVDGGALVRHRWNLAWTGTRWITVDASQPDAPAPRLGVGIGDETATSLAAAAMFDLAAR